MNAVYDQDDPRALFPETEKRWRERLEPIRANKALRMEVYLDREAVPDDFSRSPVPVIRVDELPDEIHFVIWSSLKDYSDNMDLYCSRFWFRDRLEFRAAWRMARIIAGGRKINRSLIGACGADICCDISSLHYAGDAA